MRKINYYNTSALNKGPIIFCLHYWAVHYMSWCNLMISGINVSTLGGVDWLSCGFMSTRHKIRHFGDIPKPISSLGMEKQNLTQQKHIHQSKEMYYNIK